MQHCKGQSCFCSYLGKRILYKLHFVVGITLFKCDSFGLGIIFIRCTWFWWLLTNFLVLVQNELRVICTWLYVCSSQFCGPSVAIFVHIWIHYFQALLPLIEPSWNWFTPFKKICHLSVFKDISCFLLILSKAINFVDKGSSYTWDSKSEPWVICWSKSLRCITQLDIQVHSTFFLAIICNIHSTFFLPIIRNITYQNCTWTENLWPNLARNSLYFSMNIIFFLFHFFFLISILLEIFTDRVVSLEDRLSGFSMTPLFLWILRVLTPYFF